MTHFARPQPKRAGGAKAATRSDIQRGSIITRDVLEDNVATWQETPTAFADKQEKKVYLVVSLVKIKILPFLSILHKLHPQLNHYQMHQIIILLVVIIVLVQQQIFKPILLGKLMVHKVMHHMVQTQQCMVQLALQQI
eukprot:UN02388